MNLALHEHPLEGLPKLWDWYCVKQSDPTKQPYENLLWNLTRGLVSPGREGIRAWMNGLDGFMRTSANKLDDFLLADSLSQELGKSITEIFATLCESSIRLGEGPKTLSHIRSLASHTNLSALRFLTAWVALNIGDLNTCIDECEKEMEPHAPIYTILGQAFLESGRAPEAIDALKIAIKLDGYDALALFQLIKALLVSDRALEAVEYIEKCREISGENVEIECLAAMVLLSSHDNSSPFAQATMVKLVNSFEQDPGNLDLLTLAFDVSDECRNQEMAVQLFKIADIGLLSKKPDFFAKISKFLKRLGERNWYLISVQLTEKIAPFLGTVTTLKI